MSRRRTRIPGLDARPLAEAEEATLGLRVAAGDPEARSELIARNYPRALSFALRYAGRCSIDADDLAGHAAVGLCLAAARLDPSRGRFGTIAHKYMLQRVTRAIHLEARRPEPLPPDAPEFASLAAPAPAAPGRVDRIASAVDSLPGDLAALIRRHYGLDGSPPATLATLARDAGLGLSGIHWRACKARRLLREALGEEFGRTGS